MNRAMRILVAGSGIGVGGGILGFLLLMPIIGPASAGDVLPYLVGGFGVVGYIVAARYLR